MSQAIHGEQKNVLIKMFHGLGDVVQFTVVLRHLAKYRPGWNIDVVADIGKCTALNGLCRRVLVRNKDRYDRGIYDLCFDLDWDENYTRYPDKPNTKITKCLQEVFGISYDSVIGSYLIRSSIKSRDSALAYLEEIGAVKVGDRHNVAVIHYEGNTSPWKKNLSHDQASRIISFIIEKGLIPILLDWDNRSPLIDQKTIFSPSVRHPLWGNIGTGCASTIFELIQLATLYIGIDSGPGKVASATSTPSWIVWTGHHPYQFHDPSFSTTHILSSERIPPSEIDQIRCLFEKTYLHEYYHEKNQIIDVLLRSISRSVFNKNLPNQSDDLIEIQSGLFIRKKFYNEDACIWMDVVVNDCYSVPYLPLGGRGVTVLDIGSCFGAFAFLWHQRNPNSKIICVEPAPLNVKILRKNVGHFATVLDGAVWYGENMFLADSTSGIVTMSTGGSMLVSSEASIAGLRNRDEYKVSSNRVPLFTIESILSDCGITKIDYLKTDCEGGEYSFLSQSSSLHRISKIFGEYHDCDRWSVFKESVFHCEGWSYVGSDVNLANGLFQAENKSFALKVPSDFSEKLIGTVRSNHDQTFVSEAFARIGLLYFIYTLTLSAKPKSAVCFGSGAGIIPLAVRLADESVFQIGIDTGRRGKDQVEKSKSMLGPGFTVFYADINFLESISPIDLFIIDGIREPESAAKFIRSAAKSKPKYILVITKSASECEEKVLETIEDPAISECFDFEKVPVHCDLISVISGARKHTSLSISGQNLSIHWNLDRCVTVSDIEIIKSYMANHDYQGLNFTSQIESYLGFCDHVPWIAKVSKSFVSINFTDLPQEKCKLVCGDIIPHKVDEEGFQRLQSKGLKHCLILIDGLEDNDVIDDAKKIIKKNYRVIIGNVQSTNSARIANLSSVIEDGIFPRAAWSGRHYIAFAKTCDIIIAKDQDFSDICGVVAPGIRVQTSFFDREA